MTDENFEGISSPFGRAVILSGTVPINENPTVGAMRLSFNLSLGMGTGTGSSTAFSSDNPSNLLEHFDASNSDDYNSEEVAETDFVPLDPYDNESVHEALGYDAGVSIDDLLCEEKIDPIIDAYFAKFNPYVWEYFGTMYYMLHDGYMRSKADAEYSLNSFLDKEYFFDISQDQNLFVSENEDEDSGLSEGIAEDVAEIRYWAWIDDNDSSVDHHDDDGNSLNSPFVEVTDNLAIKIGKAVEQEYELRMFNSSVRPPQNIFFSAVYTSCKEALLREISQSHSSFSNERMSFLEMTSAVMLRLRYAFRAEDVADIMGISEFKVQELIEPFVDEG